MLENPILGTQIHPSKSEKKQDITLSKGNSRTYNNLLDLQDLKKSGVFFNL